MAASKINVLITSFAGAGLPPTLSLALPSTTPISSLRDELDSRLPESCTTSAARLLLTTLSNRSIPLDSPLPISHFLLHRSSSISNQGEEEKEQREQEQQDDDLLPLRLSAPLRGGKGGFGSQLRAAGGRMSKRKKGAGAQGEDNGSSRNLDGRRLRTVTEAKALAEYLAIKPEMERKEKERRRKRWEQIVEMTERRQEEIRYGSKRVGLDGKWIEDKEETGERTREAVLEAMRKGAYRDNLVGEQGGSSSAEEADEVMGDGDEGEDESSGASKATTPPSEPEPEPKGKGKEKAKESGNGTARRFFGFDDDDEFMSSEDDEEEGQGETAKS
ncbi:hypothetical protein VTK56DRAFT_7444 [Thermocarpiscus australiensis]